MPQQVHATPTRTTAKPSSAEMEQLATDDTPQSSDHVTVEDVDEILEAIDEILEENALEVVRAYRQRGGQ